MERTENNILENFLAGVEYPRVLEGIAAACTTRPGRAFLEAMRPLPESAAIRARLESTRLSEEHRARFGDAPIPDPEGPGRSLRRAQAQGETFSGAELASLASFLDGAARLRRHLSQGDGEKPVFPGWMDRLDTHPVLRDELRRCLLETGEVLDGASPTLKTAREALRRTRAQVEDFYQKLLSRTDLQDVLRERTVTERSLRRVVPVKRDQQPQLPGIVHGLSASGSTVFLEPREAVPLNNALSEAVLTEEEEVRKVLWDLTQRTLAARTTLEGVFLLCAEVDAHSALAQFAGRFACQYLEPEPGAVLLLKDARHPLLCLEAGEAFRERAVPLDLAPPDGARVVLVSGPNAGGKTVALKTLGLVCALAQAGLPVPASATSRLPLFPHFDTDLGDGQSLQDHLSTYEAKLRALRRMLDCAAPGALLLIDELGAGTDPQEGGALGLACLEAFRERGAFVLATTHQPLLKLFAQEELGMLNAAMRMDEATGRPTYRLETGFPGRSYAIELARKVGFPDDLLEKARGRLPQGEVDLTETLAKLEGERQALGEARREAERTRDGVRKMESELREAKKQIKDEARRIRREAQTEAEGLLRNTRRRMEHILQGVDGAEDGVREKIRQARKEVEVKLGNLASQKEKAPLPPVRELHPGDEVFFKPGSLRARVLEADPEKRTAFLQTGGGPRFSCRFEDLGDLSPQAPVAGRAGKGPGWTSTGSQDEAVVLELDIRGYTVDAGCQAVNRHLDRAMLQGLPFVRVLHGKGTGKLKEGVLAALKEHPAVGDFRDAEYNQGGSGVTVVNLKKD